MRRFLAGLLIVVSAVTLLLASTSLWTRRNVVNTQVFIGNVQEIIDLPQVEARIADRVTTTVMANPQVQQTVDDALTALPPRLERFRPTVENGVRSLVSAGVTRLLTNDPFRPLTTAALTSVHTQLINGQDVRFTLGQAKARVPASLKDGLAGQVLDLLPDDVGVTLLSTADSPQIYSAIDLLKSVWWWFGLIALATLAGALGISRRGRSTLRAWAVTTAVLGVLLLATLRIARGRLLPQVQPDNRNAVGAIYDSIASSLRAWTLWLVAVMVVVVVLTLVWGRLGLVAGVRHAATVARQRGIERRLARAAVPVDGATGTAAADGEVAVPDESWGRRVAAGTSAFVDGLDLRTRAAGLGTAVAAHYRPARWAGIGMGVLLLLLWPAPTLSVLIWVAALVGLYLWALDWLRDQAPAVPVAAVPTATPTATATAATPVVPEPRPTPNADQHQAAVPAGPPPLTPELLTPAAISVLNDRLDLLVRLGAAHDSGVLSDAEFDREKSRLMSV